MRIAHAIHYPILQFAMHHKLAVLGFAASVLVLAFGMIAPNLGSEFVPKLSEGAMAIGVVRLAGTDLDESVRDNTQMEKAILAAFPDEVENVWSRIGTAEVATDPMGVELTDIFITLKPRSTVEESPNSSELTDSVRATPARSRAQAGLLAADRNANERNGLRRAGRLGRQTVRRRL